MTYLIKFDNLRVNAFLSVIVNKVSKSNTLATTELQNFELFLMY